ncbi:MAG: thiolase family protein [Sphingobacterium sp.]
MKNNKVYIVAAKRTPIGSFGGMLSTVAAPELAAFAIRAALTETGLAAEVLDEVLMGSVLQANLGQAPARQAAKIAGLSDEIPATTINKVCASGMKAISLAAQSIRLGDAQLVVAGGMENMSRVPYYAGNTRWGEKYGNGELLDGLQRDGLSDAYSEQAMGVFGELCAEKFNIGRTEQDAYALSSYHRSGAAWHTGKFLSEVVPVAVKTKGETKTVSQDEEYTKLNEEKVGRLRAAFKAGGTITAANASKLSDGAAAVILASQEGLDRYGLTPLAEIVACADAEQSPEWFTTSPALAARRVLEKAGLQIKAIDFVECNEAFAVVALANAQLLNIDSERLNVYGGAVALGHPLGCSGARIVVTLNNILHQERGNYGLAMICNGGGGASALILKKC